MGIPAPVQEDGSVPMTANLGWGYKAVKREMEALIGIYTRSEMMRMLQLLENNGKVAEEETVIWLWLH